MDVTSDRTYKLPREQEAIRAKCFHPTGKFVEFTKEEVEQSIPNRFEKIVRLYPDRTAVEAGSRAVTYAEINAMANRVAAAILARQGEKAEPIGVLFEKGIAQIAAMLGVLKAGKFFVLLDPAFPKQRIAAMVEDSQAELVFTDRRNVSLSREVARSHHRLLEFPSIDLAIPIENLCLPISPDALAFITYTSGSTGQPKGVAQNHRNMLHQVMLRTNVYHVCEQDRLGLLASGTSNAVNYTFHALLNGASLLPFDVKKEGVARLARWLSQERISICGIGAPLFRNLVEALTGEEKFPDLRLIQMGSDTIFKSDVDSYKKYFTPDCILATGVSSSETGLMREYLIDSKTCIDGSGVPVGYPIDGKEILLLDDAGKEIGFNEIGEIAVRSSYISPGYWRKPELTEAKFRPAPKDCEERLYLTGDLGLMLADGCLFHKGRKDFRVKIRGYGVELAEVEKALVSHPAVKEAVVAARPDDLGEARLVAYITSFGQPSATAQELRDFLKEKLSEYMIPSVFVPLDALPLTPNGKVDRQALPNPGNSRPSLLTPFVMPWTAVEQQLAQIWAAILSVDQVGIHDNFFDLGGHSLSATRVISHIRDDFRVELSLSHFFETPTVTALAGYIETAPPLKDEAIARSIEPASRDGQFLPSFAQQRLWFIDQLDPRSTAYNLFSAVKLTGRLNVPALARSFNEIIRRHEVLRTVFRAVDGEPFQFILPSMSIKVPVVDLLEIVSDQEREIEIRRLATVEAQRPFDLASGPLLRVTLLRLAEDEYLLLLTIHHIAFDGWSRAVLDRELSVIYAAFTSGQPASLPALPIQYADFAQWQRLRLRGNVLEKQLAYWRKQLDNVPVLQLPSDRPRPAVQTSKGARQSFTLSNDLIGALKIFAPQEGVTLFMTLLAAYVTLLHHHAGQNDIAIGSAIAGRERIEFESLIGFFLNMLVLRTDVSGNPTFRELLSRARQVCLEAYANQDVPFEKLVQELQPQRNLSHDPLFQATFAFQNTPTCPLKLAGVTVQDFDLGSGIASFDLHLFIVEEEAGLHGWLVYNTDLFDTATIARLVSHFQMILDAIVANPDQRVSELSLLTEDERRQLLVQWNDTKKDYPRDKCIHELFKAQAEKTPDAVAVVFEDKELTSLITVGQGPIEARFCKDRLDKSCSMGYCRVDESRQAIQRHS